MNRILKYTFCSFILLLIMQQIPLIAKAASEVNDADALNQVDAAKAIFDVRVNKPEILVLYLQVIKQTHEDLIRQGQTPEFVVAFRGPSIRLITSENWSFSEEDQRNIEKSATLIEELKSRGVKLEACSVAARLFNVDRQTIIAAIKPVGNTFVSLIGYQTKGYKLIPVN